MYRRILVSTSLLCMLASSAFSAPTLTVANGGLAGGNQQWLISATPDVATFVANYVAGRRTGFHVPRHNH